MKLIVRSDYTFDCEVEGATAQEAWKEAAFWQSLPRICPVDQTPVRFGYAKRGGYDFYFLESTGTPRYEFQFGTDVDSKQLFPGKVRGQGKDKRTVQEWAYWDAEREVQVVAWRDGQLLIKLEAGEVQHRQIASDADIDKLMDETQPVNQVGPDPWEMAYKVFDDLGMALYAQQWRQVCRHNVERVSGGQLSDAQQLTLEQLVKLTDGMRKLQQKRVHVVA